MTGDDMFNLFIGIWVFTARLIKFAVVSLLDVLSNKEAWNGQGKEKDE